MFRLYTRIVALSFRWRCLVLRTRRRLGIGDTIHPPPCAPFPLCSCLLAPSLGLLLLHRTPYTYFRCGAASPLPFWTVATLPSHAPFNLLAQCGCLSIAKQKPTLTGLDKIFTRQIIGNTNRAAIGLLLNLEQFLPVSMPSLKSRCDGPSALTMAIKGLKEGSPSSATASQALAGVTHRVSNPLAAPALPWSSPRLVPRVALGTNPVSKVPHHT